MKTIFIAATRQNDGKTMVSLGLFNAFAKRFKSIGYMKPVGQQYKVIEDQKIDKDAVLFYQTFGLKDKLADMSPIAVPRGFTESYIQNPNRDQLVKDLQSAQKRLGKGKDFVLYEGTGHAGVGSVFDMANAQVAKILGTKVILVALGGVGRCIDELMLNKAQFEMNGIDIAGVIINKVRQAKYDKVKQLVVTGLKRHGLRVFGVIPFVNMLTWPSVKSLLEDLKADLLSGESGLMNSVEKFVIGDMLPHDALDVFTGNSVLVVPGNREGLILTALCGNLLESHPEKSVSAIIFTSGIRPHYKIMDMIGRTNIPLLLVKEDSFTIASRINNMILKLQSEDSEKIDKTRDLVEEYVDVDAICEAL